MTADPYARLVVHGTDGATYDLGSWRLAPGRRVIFASGTALSETLCRAVGEWGRR